MKYVGKGSIAIAAILCITIASVSAIMPSMHVRHLDKDVPSEDMIFIRGKYFRRSNAVNTEHTRGIPEGPVDINSNVQMVKPQGGYMNASWFSQQCYDHDSTTCTKWNQRYWIKWDYYKTGGPIFFMFGGEGDATGLIDGGQWMWYAYKYGAVCVVLEHRFYGQSFPSTDSSASTLRVLTSHQAMEDAVTFIKWFKSYYHDVQYAKLVAFGGSYPGNLAAWFRQKYPRVANAAVSSSAPVEAKYDFPEYMQTVSEVIYYMQPQGHACYFALQSSFGCMENLVHNYTCSNSRYTSKSQLSTALHMCFQYQLDYPNHREAFFQGLGMHWASNYPGTENAPKCSKLESQKMNTADVIDYYGNYRVQDGNDVCGSTGRRDLRDQASEPRDEVVEFLQSGAGEAEDGKSWTWQTCNEFGYFQSADPKYQVFGYDWSAKIYADQCARIWPDAGFTPDKIKANIDKTNLYYKGKKNDGTCIVFVNGQWDPWHPLGINQASETNSKNIAVSIPRSQHCEDMSHDDSKTERAAAQKNIEDQIGIYLNDPSCA